MPHAQYTAVRTSETRSPASSLLVLALLATLGASSPASAALSRPVALPAQTSSDPDWEDDIWDIMRQIYAALLGNLFDYDHNAPSATLGMQMVTNQYAYLGTTPQMSATARAALMAEVDQAACLLKNPPAGTDQNTVNQCLKTLTAIWIDLGGYPGDLGC